MKIVKEHTVVCLKGGCEVEDITPPPGVCIAAQGIRLKRGKVAPGVHVHVHCDACRDGHIAWGQNEAPGVGA